MLEKCFPSFFPPPLIHLWGRIGKAGVRGWWVDLCISAAAWSPPTQGLWAGAPLSLSAFLPFSFSLLPRIPPLFNVQHFLSPAALGGCVWLLLSLSLVYLSFSVPLSRPLPFPCTGMWAWLKEWKNVTSTGMAYGGDRAIRKQAFPPAVAQAFFMFASQNVEEFSLGFCELPLMPCLAFFTHFSRTLLFHWKIEASV